jgi:hypothetical protein
VYDLDCSLLPQIVRHGIFKNLPAFIDEPLSKLELPETLDRVRSAHRFLAEVSATEKDWINRGYLRAGLSEFRSVDEALRWDLGNRGGHIPTKSRNPLVHLLYRLRRLTVYVANAPIKEQQVTAKLQLGDMTHEADIKLLVIPDIEKYVRQGNIDAYRAEDMEQVCSWFEENQKVYGAPQVLETGVGLYCQELCEIYANRTSPETL